jgi:ribose 1,5-bisphosphokinase PhnN
MFMDQIVKAPKRWETRARLFLKAEIVRADITWEELAKRLAEHGFRENAASIANRLARGTFPATFFLTCLVALGVEGLTLAAL